MAFQNENIEIKLSKNNVFQKGVSNVDTGLVIERGVLLPWVSDPVVSWLYYECTVEVMLDSGIVVHNKLPQADKPPDSLSVLDFDDQNYDKFKGSGINLKCHDQYQDTVQRMAHARYWFRLIGQALRFGYQVPIPKLVKIGGVPAIPYDKNPQWAYNRIAPGTNFSGIPLWEASWSLWYTTAKPPVSNYVPNTDPSAHIRGDTPLPNLNGVQTPFSQPDDNAVRNNPPTPAQSLTGLPNIPPNTPFP